MATPVEHTQWAVFDDGSVGQWRYEGDTPPALPAPGRLVSQEEYQQARDQIRTSNETFAAEAEAEELAARRTAYEALVAVGIPEASAQQITGYRPPQEEDDA